MRNRRPAQRRQVDAVQLSVERQGAGGEFSFLYDRTQRRGHHGARRADREPRENRHPKKIIPTTIEIVDIAGLVKGASKGEGLGNKFLANIRETDAIIHVLRCFENDNITHVDGTIDPVRDKEIIDTELQLKDLETVENRIGKVSKQAATGDKTAKRLFDILSRYKAALEQGKSARTVELDKEDRKAVHDLHLLTDKPVLYVCNVGRKERGERQLPCGCRPRGDPRRECRTADRSGGDRGRHRRTGRPTRNGRCFWRRRDSASRASAG